MDKIEAYIQKLDNRRKFAERIIRLREYGDDTIKNQNIRGFYDTESYWSSREVSGPQTEAGYDTDPVYGNLDEVISDTLKKSPETAKKARLIQHKIDKRIMTETEYTHILETPVSDLAEEIGNDRYDDVKWKYMAGWVIYQTAEKARAELEEIDPDLLDKYEIIQGLHSENLPKKKSHKHFVFIKRGNLSMAWSPYSDSGVKGLYSIYCTNQDPSLEDALGIGYIDGLTLKEGIEISEVISNNSKSSLKKLAKRYGVKKEKGGKKL